jgi:hypothetical protein
MMFCQNLISPVAGLFVFSTIPLSEKDMFISFHEFTAYADLMTTAAIYLHMHLAAAEQSVTGSDSGPTAHSMSVTKSYIRLYQQCQCTGGSGTSLK